MNVIAPKTTNRFADRLNRFLPRVNHRSAINGEDKRLVFQTRYAAYLRSGMLVQKEEDFLYDRIYDESPNAWITMSYIDGEFASTLRLHVANRRNSVLPSLTVFRDVIEPQLQAGRIVVDPTRLAARLDAAVRHPELPYIALRPGWMALEHFQADLAIATVAKEHEPFYRHVFGYVPLTEPRDYPLLTFKVVCLGLDFKSAKSDVERRYPFFQSTGEEREALFGPAPPVRGAAGLAPAAALRVSSAVQLQPSP